ncbi:exodeoxyribonuclease VII small subunit [Granulicatella sp. zg-ZJ]|uniref:exodeoxyribonuclease VII small subunit n=1 Tax=unclassified Granulicatella TaxID=2630493 RepID=UPI0013C108BF|nr:MULTISPECIES: exodeoxyribonuclease VII small subunit [unclassified Granulicatella]MBS4751062.1 exodeoxyribonuclease VII small subunit [Carnobacteriaceae bacterium zg-ZUI78]NEW62810.1 exodeoxyribonuclease VII small subunit [Granulicatella sp. zg-ZJ]NEW65434.1 exodeoxyribonuclease VII small subunit [Granulicatella sp. zg-84]QMI85230.1 exodeoxyribonuclease VII small subunit [Carnobacteriaceae bacterium zg-84]
MAKGKSFEEALKELEVIVQQLERADVPLEEALKQFQKGIELSQYCKQTLENAEKTVTKLVLENGEETILDTNG